MKKSIITLSLILTYFMGLSQSKIALSLDSESKAPCEKIRSIDTYTETIDQKKNLYSVLKTIKPGIGKYAISVYEELFDRRTHTLVKSILINQFAKISYFKDDQLVLTKEIHSIKANISKIKSTYFEKNILLYSNSAFANEHVQQITYTSSGSESGGSFTMIINKDSIIFNTSRKKITSANWIDLNKAINLFDFDSIESDRGTAYIDGIDVSCVILTDVREHKVLNSFKYYTANANRSITFFNLLNQLEQQMEQR